MRIILFIALISSTAFGQAIDTGNGSNGACTGATISSGTGDSSSGTAMVYNCTTLTVSSAPAFPTGGLPLVIKVQGAVLINAALNLNGGSGSYSNSANGGVGGIGADSGGAYFLGSNSAPNSPANGGVSGIDSGSCAGGGGAGSFITLGTNGLACPTGSAGGNAGSNTYDPFVSQFRGGFGGGSGGEGPPGDAGSGGGGGGALHIMAGGNVEINANISAKGGNGGSAGAGQNGGPGGGGSGGVIWIQTLGQITNNGTIDVSGGSGGTSPLGTRGGNGGNGVFKLEDADGVIAGTGSGTSSSSSKLTSSISCGNLKANDHSTLPQTLMGFSLVVLFQILCQRLKRLRYSEAKA